VVRREEREEGTGQASRRRGGVTSQRASESSGAQQGCGVDEAKCPFCPGGNAGWSVGAGAIVGMGFGGALPPLAFSGLRSGWWVRPRGGRLVVAPSVEATLAVPVLGA